MNPDDSTVALLKEIRDGINRLGTPAERLEAVLDRQADATVRAAEVHAASWDRLSSAIRDKSGAMRENASAWREGAQAMRGLAEAVRDLGPRRTNGHGGPVSGD